MIEYKNVSKAFNDSEAVKNATLTINKGSIYGLLGSNGAGKTTLLKLLAGIYKQDSGTITVNGQPIYENLLIKQNIFFIPDIPFVLPQYTVKQMANFYRGMYPNWSDERFNELSNIFEIDVNKKIQTFSKGVQRQVAFWLAFATMPEILVLDEPMDGLDPVIRRKVRGLLVEEVAERELTILISSHNLKEIEDLSDHVAIIHNGKVLLEKELDDLKTDIHKIQVAFKGELPKDITKLQGLLHFEKRGSVILCIVRGNEDKVVNDIKNFHPVILDLLPLSLEEIFIYEMGDVGYAIKNVLD